MVPKFRSTALCLLHPIFLTGDVYADESEVTCVPSAASSAVVISLACTTVHRLTKCLYLSIS